MNGKIKKIVEYLCRVMDTPYFALILTVAELTCYFLSLDIVIIAIISLFISFTLLFKKNYNVLFLIFLYMQTMISLKNSPGLSSGSDSGNNFDYYFQPTIFIPIIFFVAIPVGIATFIAIQNFIKGKVKFDAFTITTLILGLSFLTNGLFTKDYNPLGLMFGVFMFFFFVAIYFAVVPYTKVDKESLLIMSKQVAIFTLVPIIEMIVFYIDCVKSGQTLFTRSNGIFLGWGNRNTISMLFVIGLVFVIYLIRKEEKTIYKVLNHILASVIMVLIILTYSRQGYLFLIISVFGSLIVAITYSEKEKRKTYAILIPCWAVFSVVITLVGYFAGFFEEIGMSFYVEDRLTLWKSAFDAFLDNFIFGKGFYFLGGDPVVQLNSVMPLCAHNTLFEMLGACGLFGLGAYVTYRALSVKYILKNMTVERSYFVIALASFLLMSLIDIHLFDLLGTAIYISLFAITMANNKQEEA